MLPRSSLKMEGMGAEAIRPGPSLTCALSKMASVPTATKSVTLGERVDMVETVVVVVVVLE